MTGGLAHVSFIGLLQAWPELRRALKAEVGGGKLRGAKIHPAKVLMSGQGLKETWPRGEWILGAPHNPAKRLPVCLCVCVCDWEARVSLWLDHSTCLARHLTEKKRKCLPGIKACDEWCGGCLAAAKAGLVSPGVFRPMMKWSLTASCQLFHFSISPGLGPLPPSCVWRRSLEAGIIYDGAGCGAGSHSSGTQPPLPHSNPSQPNQSFQNGRTQLER